MGKLLRRVPYHVLAFILAIASSALFTRASDPEHPPPTDAPGEHEPEDECSEGHGEAHLRTNVLAVTAFGSIVLIFALVMEFVIDKVEHCFGKQKQIMKIIQAIYKELMIMGMIAFAIFLLEQSGLAARLSDSIANFLKIPCPEAVHSVFEKVHMGLFALMIIYIGLCLYLIVLHVIIYRYWNIFQLSTKDKYQTKLDVETQVRRSRSCFVNAFNCLSFCRVRSWSRAIEWQNLRESLISRFDLPGNFAFTLYMKYGMRETVVALLELHPINWLIILVLMWLNWARSAIKETHFDTGVTAEWGLFAAQAALLLIQFGVLIKCWLVYGKLTKLETVTSPSASKRETLLTSQVVDDFAHMPLSIMNEYELIHQLQEVRKKREHEQRKHTSDHAALFWFGKPRLLVGIIQMLLLLQAWGFGLGLYFAVTYSRTADPPPFWLVLLLFVPPIISFAVMCPLFMSILVKITFTGDLAHRDLVLKAYYKQKKLGKKVDEETADEPASDKELRQPTDDENPPDRDFAETDRLIQRR